MCPLRTSLLVPLRLTLSSAQGLDDSEGNQAEPTINRQSQIDLERCVPGPRRQKGQQKKVSRVPQQDCYQGVHEIIHRSFRHRSFQHLTVSS
jgi:hypothetical protein